MSSMANSAAGVAAVVAATLDDLAQARAHKEAAEYEAALEHYRRVVAQAPRDFPQLAAAQVELGLVLGFMGEFDDSLAVLEQSATQWPGSAYAHLNLGKTLLMLGQYGEARAPLKRAADLTPPDDALHTDACRQLSLLCQCGY